MSRLRLSSTSFSEKGMAAILPRKSPSNPYILASAVPCFGGFDKTETTKYRKGLFRFKKEKGLARRNTLSSCNVLTEFLEEREHTTKKAGRSIDDVDMRKAFTATLPRFSSVYHSRQNSTGEVEVKHRYGKSSGSTKHRYACSKMSEGRKAQIIVLDDTTLEILIQPKLYAVELLDLVASRFGLKEREYFGLAFRDETNHFQWLQLDRKVLEHEFIKKTGALVLYFAIRFFIESITYLRDSATIELFYCLAKQAVYKEQIECSSDVVFELAALALHEAFGDYGEDETAKKHLMKLPVLPTGVLKEHPSIAFCEDHVIEHYKKMVGRSRGDVIVQYMSITESLPTYGIHYYEVKDKSGIPWWLGLSYKGISLYDNNDKKMPRKVFAWSQLENLYYREKKFSIEVHDPKRVIHTLSSFNLYEDAILEPLEDFDDLSDAISDPTTQVSVSRRTFGPGNVNVHAWFAATPPLTKSIWSMAVSQHQFYLDRKQTRSQYNVGRSMSDIAVDLCQTPPVFSNSNTPDGLRSVSSSQCFSSAALLSTSCASVESNGADSESNKATQREIYAAVKARKEAIEEKLRSSLEKLKEICLQEAEITGELPDEYPLESGEPAPVVRKRVGTTFPLSPKIINCDAEGRDELAQLEIEYELQSKITKAAYKLIQENNDKNFRKARQHAYQRELEKLRALEQKLIECQRKEAVEVNSQEEKRLFAPLTPPHLPRHHFYDCTDAVSMPQLYRHKIPQTEFKRIFNSSDFSCAQAADAEDRKLRHGTMIPTQPLQPKSAPSSPVRQFYSQQHPLSGLASPTPTRHHRILLPSSSLHVKPLPHCNHSHQGNGAKCRVLRQLSNRVPVHAIACAERDKNLYNLKTCQSDCYMSGDELNVVPANACSQKIHWMLANDSLCSLHKAYREQVDGADCCPLVSHEGLDLSGARKTLDYGGYKRPMHFFSYENEIYGSPLQYDNLYECSAVASQPLFPSKSPSKDSAIHLGCSSSNLSSHAAIPRRCEPLQMPTQPHSQFMRFHTPPFLTQDDHPLYEGVNLSNSEVSPSPEQLGLATKNPGFREVSKPFEMSDFYKYSERLRRQRQHKEDMNSPLRSSSSGSLPQITRSVGALKQHNLSSGCSSSVSSSDQAASVDELIVQGCGLKELDCLYHVRHKGMFHSQIPMVGSDSCIDYPPQDEVLTRSLAAQPILSSPFITTQAMESGAYLQADKNRSSVEPNEVSFGSFRAGDGVAEAFGEEMLAWFEKNEQLSQSPDGPSTLV